MKMLKKAAAVLLAAAMSLVMLTACGGGSSSVAKTDAQKMEDAYIAVFSTVLGKECTNDSALKEQAKTAFNANVAEDNSVKTGMGNISTSETEISMFYIPVAEDGKAQGMTSEQVNAMSDTNAVKAMAASYSKLMAMYNVDTSHVSATGVYAVTKNDGKTYVALALTVKK